MKTAYYIRIAIQDDLPEMIAILQTSSQDWSASLLEDSFFENYIHWVICFEDEIKGFVIIRKNFDAWEIMQIVIDFQYQRQGLATRLLRFVMDEAKKKSMERIQLEVRQSNTRAIALYLRCGFHEVGLRKRYYPDGEDALLMDCLLASE